MADAEAICEAVGRPNMRFVSIKTIEQQAIRFVSLTTCSFLQQVTISIHCLKIGIHYRFSKTIILLVSI
jgi:transposase